MSKNKLHLRVVKDSKNKWFSHVRKANDGNNYRLQLCWDRRKGWFFIKQMADELGFKDFMKQFTQILDSMERNQQSAFTLYISNHNEE